MQGRTARRRCRARGNNERNYKCGICTKSYLSYPALYTHMKLRHNLEQIFCKHPKFLEISDLFKTGTNDKKSEEYFINLREVAKELTTQKENNPLLNSLTKQIFSDKPLRDGEKLVQTEIGLNSGDYPNEKIFKITSEHTEESKELTADDALAKYYKEAYSCNEEGINKLFTIFVLKYRECFNENGPRKKAINNLEKLRKENESNLPISDEISLEEIKEEERRIKESVKEGHEFSECEGPELLPLIAEEFNTFEVGYKERKDAKTIHGIPYYACINLTRRFLSWLKEKNYTKIDFEIQGKIEEGLEISYFPEIAGIRRRGIDIPYRSRPTRS